MGLTITDIICRYNTRLQSIGAEPIAESDAWDTFTVQWQQYRAHCRTLLLAGPRPIHERWSSPEAVPCIADGNGSLWSLDNGISIKQQDACDYTLNEYLHGLPDADQWNDLPAKAKELSLDLSLLRVQYGGILGPDSWLALSLCRKYIYEQLIKAKTPEAKRKTAATVKTRQRRTSKP
jgi:hypothetical protein